MISYLVLAHRAPEQVSALADVITSAGDTVLVHVDQRVDDRPFRVCLAHQPTSVFVEDRVPVHWGGWSMVEATLRLIQRSLDQHPDCRRLVLLSGDSYPLRSPHHLRSFFRDHPTDEFISAVPMPSEVVRKPLSRISHVYVEHDPTTRLIGPSLALVNRLAYRPAWRRALRGRRPFAGSMWWALTADAARLALETYRTESDFAWLMRHSKSPDEHFFQTVLCNSTFAARTRPGVMFTTFAGASPKPLDLATVDRLARPRGTYLDDHYGARHVLFARKVAPGSTQVTRAIRERLWSTDGIDGHG